MNKAFLYVRVSSKEQEKEGYSIPAQLKLLNSYAEENKIAIVRNFEDVETAKSSGRTQFGEMIKYLRKQKDVKIILVEKTDRLYRNLKDWVTVDELINDYDIEIHLVKENSIISKNSRSHEKFIHGIKVLMAKNYTDNLSEEVRKGLLEKAEQGIYPCKAPLGYLNNKESHTIDLDSARAEFIRQLFLWYACGNYSISMLREKCKEHGFMYRRGEKIISRSNVERILKNSFYMGYFYFNGKLFKGTHSPIVTKELFDKVQEVFRKHNKPRYNKRHFAFSGLLKCAVCGCNMTAEIKKRKYVYYHCTGSRGKGHNNFIREDRLDNLLADILKPIQIDTEHLEWVKSALSSSHKDMKEDYQRSLNKLQDRYNKIQEQIGQAYQDKLDGLIDKDFWNKKSADLTLEAQQIKDSLDQYEKVNTNYYEDGTRILELSQRAYSLYLRQKPDEKRRFLNLLLSNCTYHNGTLCPSYRKPFDIIAEGVKTANWLGDRDSNPGFVVQSHTSCLWTIPQ